MRELFCMLDRALMPIVRCSSTKFCVTFLSDSSVLMPSGCIGISLTRRSAPVGIALWKPTVNSVAVSLSMAILRTAFRCTDGGRVP